MQRGQFSSRFGFLMAAAGSAVGLGNIWSFPTNTAESGGGAFVLVYLVLTFLLAYPALMAELTIGRHTQSNVVGALDKLATGPFSRIAAKFVGLGGVLTASMILSFYAIVAGWMLSYLLVPVAQVTGATGAEAWLTGGSPANPGNWWFFTAIFAALTMMIIGKGIENGIEKWSSRLMPSLLGLLIALIIYVMMQPGAMKGLQVYLVPNFDHIGPNLILSALGQAFFSLSLGVGTMLVYGSYLSKQENLPKLGASLALIDVGIAFTAGLLIIPALFVAEAAGTEIYADGSLIAGPDLILQVLPKLFESMGSIGMLVSFAFFALMSIAALTSSISMLEVPVSYLIERFGLSRNRATQIAGSLILAFSSLIVFNFASLFGLVADLATVYFEPLLGAGFCIFVGWIWNRNSLINSIAEGAPEVKDSLFMKIWPTYVKFFCPALILLVLAQTLNLFG